LRHDEQFFEEFYQASYGRTVALVAAITGSRHEAEDVAQEAYARALARWSRLRGYDLPEAWVRKVALRITIDSGRRLRRNRAAAVRLGAGLQDRGRVRPARGDRKDPPADQADRAAEAPFHPCRSGGRHQLLPRKVMTTSASASAEPTLPAKTT
jgi:DNA-directed RNA polymerase specialized sigma24 family protein